MNFISKFCQDFSQNFLEEGRWHYIWDGLGVTLRVTLFAVLIGLAIGFVVAIIRSTYEKTHKLKFLNFLANVYLTVIRGTPVVVQLLIIYFVIFGSVRVPKIFVAIVAFGINSGAYVAEIFRSGIMSIDPGQFEAGRSLGFNYIQTMMHIVIPQAVKVILPTLWNEFIVLVKETSVAGYVGVVDLTKAGDRIRGRTFEAFMPLLAVAIVYLCIVIILTQILKVIERRLRKSER